ncbi:MAG: GNAT family N-acetyltransferase [archaeon]
MNVRNLTERDVPVLLEILAETLGENQKEEFERLLFETLKLQEEKKVFSYVFEENSEIIGAGDIFKDGDQGVIGLIVRKAYQGRGIGKFILSYLLSKSKDLGIKFVLLVVKKENLVAKRLYEKFGFVKLKDLDENLEIYVFSML